MGIPTIIADLALIMCTATVSTIVFKLLKQPVILGYIVAGFLVSAQFEFMPTIRDVADVEIWAKIGVIFLLFGLGLEFSFRKVASVGRSALIAASVIIPGMILLGTVVGHALGWSMTNSVMLGCMICMSSTAIILKALDDLDLRNHRFTGLVFGILIFEDILAIVIMVLMSTLAVSNTLEGSTLVFAIMRLVFFLILWLVTGIFFIPSILGKYKTMLNAETLLITSVGLCFGMVYIADAVGFSPEFGAFVMGSVLAETVEAERIEKVVAPIKDLFGAIFFISVGMMIDPAILAQYWLEIVVISVSIVVGQVTLGTTGVLAAGGSLRNAIQSGFSLTQVGEFAFIVALLGTQLGLCSEFLYPVIVAVSVVTIFITPFMMKSAIPVVEYVNAHLPEQWRNVLERTHISKADEQSKSVWKQLAMQLIEIVAIYGSICIAFFVLMQTYIAPTLTEQDAPVWVKVLVVFVVVLVISPFARPIICKKNHSIEYKYLLQSNKRNWAPLMLLTVVRFALVAVLVFAIIASGIASDFGGWVTLGFTAVVILWMVRSRALKYCSIKIERRFFHNLNRREYEQRLQMENSNVFRSGGLSRRLSAYDLHMADFAVHPNAHCCGKTLRELNFGSIYDVHVVSIIRGEERINIPGGNERIMPADKVLALGMDDALTAISKEFALNMEEYVGVEKKEVGLEQIEIKAGSELDGKTILESGIRDKSKCLVVGIEKKGNVNMRPDIHTEFEAGDIVWIVGERDSIMKLAEGESYSVVEAM